MCLPNTSSKIACTAQALLLLAGDNHLNSSKAELECTWEIHYAHYYSD